MEDDWDLHAVVRGCCTGAPAVSASSGPSSTAAVDTDLLHVLTLHGSSDPVEGKISSFQELHELYKPFFPKAEPLVVSPVSALEGISGSKDTVLLSQPPTQPKPSSVTYAANCGTTSQAPPRSKRRKNQFKKVCQVPAESLSSDIWAWRKYGQKPIKGSPYPRGYYRCSSSKGCLARKQVERNRSDPGMFIVTYTADHNHPAPTHRNSLAGSSRQKPATPPAAAGSGDTIPSASSPSGGKAPLSSSPATSLEEEAVLQSTSRGEHDDSMDDEEDDADVALSDMAMNDDFFVGLEGLMDGDSNEDCFLDRFPANFGLSWSAGSTAAAAGMS